MKSKSIVIMKHPLRETDRNRRRKPAKVKVLKENTQEELEKALPKFIQSKRTIQYMLSFDDNGLGSVTPVQTFTGEDIFAALLITKTILQDDLKVQDTLKKHERLEKADRIALTNGIYYLEAKCGMYSLELAKKAKMEIAQQEKKTDSKIILLK